MHFNLQNNLIHLCCEVSYHFIKHVLIKIANGELQRNPTVHFGEYHMSKKPKDLKSFHKFGLNCEEKVIFFFGALPTYTYVTLQTFSPFVFEGSGFLRKVNSKS